MPLPAQYWDAVASGSQPRGAQRQAIGSLDDGSLIALVATPPVALRSRVAGLGVPQPLVDCHRHDFVVGVLAWLLASCSLSVKAQLISRAYGAAGGPVMPGA